MTDPEKIPPADYRCGHVALVGRPNVGKSSLLNRIIGQKISITSPKPQTTHWALYGIRSEPNYQAIFVDTPGMQNRHRDSINRHLVREIRSAIAHVDVLVFMTEALSWYAADAQVLAMLGKTEAPIVCVINKIDRLPDRDRLLPFIRQVSATAKFEEIIPVSVLRNENIATLEATVAKLLPVAPPVYPVDQLSNRDERFFASEFIREKLVRVLGKELPYRVAVTIERIQQQPKITKIDAVIWVEGESQKRIIVGKNGAVLKAVGEKARNDLEAMFGVRLFLRTWVKVRKNWTGNAKAMKEFGYE